MERKNVWIYYVVFLLMRLVFPGPCSCSLRTTTTITIFIIGCLCLSGYHGGRHRVWVGRHPLSDGLCDAAARSHGRGTAALQPGHQAQVSGPAGFILGFLCQYMLHRLLFLLHEVPLVMKRNAVGKHYFLEMWNVCCSTSVQLQQI